jgi:hypothetical protein
VLRGHEPLHSERKKKMKLLVRLFVMYLDFLRSGFAEVTKLEAGEEGFKLEAVDAYGGIVLTTSFEVVPTGVVLQYVLLYESRNYLITTRFVGNDGWSFKSMTATKSNPSETRKIRLETRTLQTEDEVVRFLQPEGTDEVSVEDAMKIHSILAWLVE